MNLRTIPRTAIDGYLKLVRLPLDTAVALLPGNGTGPGAAAGLALDRADAMVRAMAGMALGDTVLTDDAARRSVAADERQRALRLRTEAERKSQGAKEHAAERHDEAERRRRQAREKADEERRRARRTAEQKKKRAAKQEQSRRQSSRKAAARTQAAVEKKGRNARLEALDAEADALREKDEALTASDEARRLRQTASKAKAQRKRS